MTANVTPADLNKVADLLIDEGKLDAAKAVKQMAVKYDGQLKAEHLDKLGGTAKALVGWNAVKEIRPNLDGVDTFDELTYGKKVEYATFSNAVEKAIGKHGIPVGSRARITGEPCTARGYEVEGYRKGDEVTVLTMPDNDGDVQVTKTRSYFHHPYTSRAYIKLASLTEIQVPF